MKRRTRAKRRIIKLSNLRRTITDSEQWSCEILGRYGYSYQFIARRVFKDSGDKEKAMVSRALRRAEIRVREYRNGETTLSKRIASGLLEGRLREAIRKRGRTG